MSRNDRTRTAQLLRLTLISAAVSSCFASGTAMANPTGANVVHGTAAIHQAGNLLQITNSPSAIINWQSFSIGQNEITRFLQQSPSSAVLNRVTSQNNPSQILGSLQSRLLDGTTTGGRVFLINPNGILFGSGAQIDVGGLVASTLNMSNDDFLAGRMRFTDGVGTSVVNQGSILTPAGGSVYLVGPAVRNEGLITSPQGEVVLAAGNSVELVNPGTPNLRVEIVAPNNEALNLGQIMADSGRIGIYAGLINQSGVVQANTAVATEDGRIILKAKGSVALTAGSVTTSTGPLEIEAANQVVVNGNVTTGPQTVTAGGGLIVRGGDINPAQLVANGGQSINAQFLEVTADPGGPVSSFVNITNNFNGDQLITTTGMNAAGEGIAIRNNGGIFAEIRQNAPGQQVINVSNADRMAVDGFAGGGVGIFASNGPQTISISGGGANALVVGSPGGVGVSNITGATQSVTAGLPGQDGSITITGPAESFRFVGIRSVGGVGAQEQVISTSGTISISGGSAPAQTISSGIFHNGTGPQEVSAAGITLQGGSSGSGNNAQLNSGTANQLIAVGADGIGLQGGLGGTNNGAFILGANQGITTTGDVTVTGGRTSAAIGGPSGTAHSLLLTAGGDVVLTGGSVAGAGALIGTTGGAPLAPTSIAINAAGNVILTGGTGANARVGSSTTVPAAGGDISISAGENIQLSSLAQSARIRTLGNVTLNAGGTINEAPNSFIEAGGLTTISSAGTSLAGPNQVTSFNAANTTTGDLVLSNTSPLLTVTGVNQVPFGALAINQAGDLTLTGTISSGPQTFNATGNISVLPSSPAFVSAFGPQSITAGGGLIVQSSAAGAAQLSASGGQMINASFVEVLAQDAPAMISNNFSGDQLIRTTGMNAAGEGLVVRSLGGFDAFANISQSAAGQSQVINVHGADKVTLNGAGSGALISANFFDSQGQGQGLAQTLSVTGAGANALNIGSAGALGASILVGGSQNIVAGASGERGSITIQGSAANTQLAGFVSNGQQNVTTSGTLSVTGGSAPAQPNNFPAGIFHNGAGSQEIIAAGIAVSGGASGSGNSAQIGANTGDQAVTVGAGGITITAGGNGTNNTAQIRQGRTGVPGGNQTIVVEGGNIALQGGASGTNNNAGIFGASQDISVTGKVAIAGGAGTGNSATIGSLGGVATDLVLSAGGDIALKSGDTANTGALIGNTGAAPLQPTTISINSGGNVTLDSGTGGQVRIGSSTSAPAAGGDISIQAAGDIRLNGTTQATRIRTLGNVTLNAGGTISEGPNGFIEAGGLTTISNAGTTLTGPNQVASFNAANSAAGDIALVNSGNLAVMASNSAPGGRITINNLAGDLSTSGPVAASGGGLANVALSAPGAIYITRPITASGTGNISLVGGAVTVDDTSVTAGGSVSVTGASLDVKGVSNGALVEAGNGFNASVGGDLRVRSVSTGGALGGWSAILADGPVNISAGSLALEGGGNIGGFAAIAGDTVSVATLGDFSLAGGSGVGAFGLLSSYRDISLTVGGSMRLDSGTGLGSFTRVQTVLPGSTIGIHFPNLASGGYFVNGVEGRISQGLTGFFNGIRPARLGRTLIVTYGE